MNLWRFLIIVLWLALTGGGYIFGQVIAWQKKHWEDVGAKLSPLDIQLVHAGDFVIKYGYLSVLVPTVLCVILGCAASDRREPVNSAD